MKKQWFSGIQVLRGILFISVLLSHSTAFFNVDGSSGCGGVAVVFTLSGFLSGYFFKHNNEPLFSQCIRSVWSKVKRFYPLYFVFLMLGVLLRYSNLKNLIASLFLVQSYFGSVEMAQSFNWPAWYLSSLMFSYFLAPIINLLIEKLHHEKILIVLILMLMISWAYLWRNNAQPYSMGYYWIYICPASRVFDFSEGILLAKLLKKRDNVTKRSELFYLLRDSFSIILFIGALIISSKIPDALNWQVFWCPISLLIIWVFAEEESLIIKSISKNKLLIFIGTISFELYISHRLILAGFAFLSTSFIVWIEAVLTITIVSYCAQVIRNGRFG